MCEGGGGGEGRKRVAYISTYICGVGWMMGKKEV